MLTALVIVAASLFSGEVYAVQQSLRLRRSHHEAAGSMEPSYVLNGTLASEWMKVHFGLAGVDETHALRHEIDRNAEARLTTCNELRAAPTKFTCSGEAPASNNAAYAMMLLGESDIDGAMCVLQQLKGSRYPVVVIHQGLSNSSVQKLHARGAKMQPMLDLMERAFLQTVDGETRTMPVEGGALRIKPTYWLLLEYDWVVALDLDVLLLGGAPDELMQCSKQTELAAVPVIPSQPQKGFSSGLMGLRPSTKVYHELTSTEVSADESYYEPGLTDHSTIHHKFVKSYLSLPKMYNVEERFWEACSGFMGYDTFVAKARSIQFVDMPRPWGTKDRDPKQAQINNEWKNRCGKDSGKYIQLMEHLGAVVERPVAESNEVV